MFDRLQNYLTQLQSDPVGFLITMAYTWGVILFSLIVHECAHGYVALKCGDPTAKMLGRLSLNPASSASAGNAVHVRLRLWLGKAGTGESAQFP